jgi:hypothetical protein
MPDNSKSCPITQIIAHVGARLHKWAVLLHNSNCYGKHSMWTIQITFAMYTSNCKFNTMLRDLPVNIRIKVSEKDLEHRHHLILHYRMSPNKT